MTGKKFPNLIKKSEIVTACLCKHKTDAPEYGNYVIGKFVFNE